MVLTNERVVKDVGCFFPSLLWGMRPKTGLCTTRDASFLEMRMLAYMNLGPSTGDVCADR